MSMTFLQLCQRLARESGTIDGTLPTSVTAQTGRLLKIVGWVGEAWEQIQNDSRDFLFRLAELNTGGLTTVGVARYTGASWGLTRFARWAADPPGAEVFTIYKQSTGVSDENAIPRIDWNLWRRRYDRGTQTNNRPVEYAISPSGEFCFGPIPDAAYVVRGLYLKSPQVLVDNSDVPEMPGDLHMAIVWKGLELLGNFDESPNTVITARALFAPFNKALYRSQTEDPHVAGRPLA